MHIILNLALKSLWLVIQSEFKNIVCMFDFVSHVGTIPTLTSGFSKVPLKTNKSSTSNYIMYGM